MIRRCKLMPRKNKDKYQHYDKINQYHAINTLWANLGEIGHSLVDGWERWSGDITDAMAQDQETLELPSINK